MAGTCSPPNALLQKAARTCSTTPGYYATQREIDMTSGASRPDDVFSPSCASTVRTTDYQAILDPRSSRYINSAPSVYDRVGTQPKGLQLPAPFTFSGGEYHDQYYRGEETPGCGQQFYTHTGFNPGAYAEPDAFPDKSQLGPMVVDNPQMMNGLIQPGVWNTYAFSTQASKDLGRQIALLPSQNEPDSVTRLTISSNLLEPLNVAQKSFIHNPSDYYTPQMQPFMSSLLNNATGVVHNLAPQNMYDSVAPSVAGSSQVPTGYIRNAVQNDAKWLLWQQFNNGQLAGLETLNREAQDADLSYATLRGLLGRPRGAYRSGPILDSTIGEYGTQVGDMSFYHAPVPARTFVNQKSIHQIGMAP